MKGMMLMREKLDEEMQAKYDDLSKKIRKEMPLFG